MDRGILYLMSSSVKGVVKFGITADKESYERRMDFLEKNGYYNVTGLKRQFAKEVENYEYKEDLLHRVLSSCRIGKSELFSLGLDEAIQLLAALEGTVIYPDQVSNEDLFIEATQILEDEDIINEEDSEKKKSWNKFKETHFSSSLTNRKYYFPSGSDLRIFDEDTNEEIASYSSPSKRKILRQAVVDLQNNDLPENFDKKTTYGLAHMLEKISGK